MSKLTKDSKIQAGKHCPFALKCGNHNPSCPSEANNLFKDHDFYCKHADQFNDIEQFPEVLEELCDICGNTPKVCECLIPTTSRLRSWHNKELSVDVPQGVDVDRIIKKLAPDKIERDLINQPNHYTWHPSGIEAVTIAQEFDYNIGTALVYLWRAGHKDGNSKEQDIKKAMKHLYFELIRLGVAKEEIEKIVE